jgi:hypothetical protein
MKKFLFASGFSLIPLFLGIGLPMVPLSGDTRLCNLFWEVVYGAALWVIDCFGALRTEAPSPVVAFGLFGWPLVVSTGLFIIGLNLQHSRWVRLRRWAIYILIASAFPVIELDKLLKAPFGYVPTYYKFLFHVY